MLKTHEESHADNVKAMEKYNVSGHERSWTNYESIQSRAKDLPAYAKSTFNMADSKIGRLGGIGSGNRAIVDRCRDIALNADDRDTAGLIDGLRASRPLDMPTSSGRRTGGTRSYFNPDIVKDTERRAKK